MRSVAGAGDRVMSLLLLAFGTLLALAGVVLAVSGVSLSEHTFDASIVTPGVVAVIGGLVLFALGLALRVLQRIEKALETRPMPRAARPAEMAPPAAEVPAEPGRVALPPRTADGAAPPRIAPRTEPAATSGLSVSADEKRLEELSGKLAEKSPAAARLANARNAEFDFALSPKAAAPKSLSPGEPADDEETKEVGEAPAVRRFNGTGGTRITPRLDLSARTPLGAQRAKGPAFDSLWPKAPRPLRAVQSSAAPAAATAAVPSAVAAPAVAVPAAIEPEPVNEPVPAEAPSAVPPAEETPAITILKSGVVDGMAYTLFSDGSIEAELPQGTLRFGSITELRNHIEQSA
jgi:hypothetical protein